MTEDRVLISRVLRGEMDAFQLLIKEHERLVSHMVGRIIKNKEDHEEICQDVFLKVYEKLAAFNFKSKLSTWIATIAYRQGINFIRKNTIEMDSISDDTFVERFVNTETPEEILSESDLDKYVLTLVEKLPQHYRMVLVLFHLEGMSYDEIAEVTAMPTGTVKNYLFRARNILKELVKVHLTKEEIV